MTDQNRLDDWLAERTPGQLAVILDNRQDVIWGAPLSGLDDLAMRLSQPGSVALALSRLPLPGIELLQALAALGPRPTLQRAAALLVIGDRSAEQQLTSTRSALAMLADRALGWLTDEESIAIDPAVPFVITEPLGIGRTVANHLEHASVAQLADIARNLRLPGGSRRAEIAAKVAAFLTDPTSVRDLIAAAPAAVQQRLRELAGGSVADTGRRPRYPQDREAENWARRHGLLFGGEYFSSELPVEVVLAIRQGEIAVNFDPDIPDFAAAPLAHSALVASAAAAATEFTETVAAVVDFITRRPVPGLKAGGIGSREVSRTAKALRVDERQIRFALELVRTLGLLAGAQGRISTHPGAAAWRAKEPAGRLADLVAAWWGLPVTPTLTHDPDGKAIPAVGGRIADGSTKTLRYAVIETFADVPEGTGLNSPDTLVERMNWQLPGIISPGEPAVAAIWAEAHLLGVLAHGALTPVGAALVSRDPAGLLAIAAKYLPPAATLGRFGSDLTVVVAGAPAAAVSGLLDGCADRESRGAAVIWRFSPGSVRRAFDEGSTAPELLGSLRKIAETDLPQPLTYLIGDVERRHGSLVVRPALSLVRSADEALLAEVAADRSLRSHRPSLVAPTVLAFQSEPGTILLALRAAGYLPVPADEAGVVNLSPPVRDVGGSLGQLSSQVRLGPDGELDRLRELADFDDDDGPEVLTELAGALLATLAARDADDGGEPTQTEALIEAFGPQLAPVERRQLAFAVENQVPVSITYRSATGGTSTRTISDIELINGLLYAWCHLRDDDRVFAIDRVQAVSPVQH
ncbi:MAG: helicase-associated domain-containing protein [Nakamurella sp.]